MNIKKFYFQIYHSFGLVYRLIYKKGKWLYEVELEIEPIYIERYMRITPSQDKHNEIFPQVNSLPEQVFPSEARICHISDSAQIKIKHTPTYFGVVVIHLCRVFWSGRLFNIG